MRTISLSQGSPGLDARGYNPVRPGRGDFAICVASLLVLCAGGPLAQAGDEEDYGRGFPLAIHSRGPVPDSPPTANWILYGGKLSGGSQKNDRQVVSHILGWAEPAAARGPVETDGLARKGKTSPRKWAPGRDRASRS